VIGSEALPIHVHVDLVPSSLDLEVVVRQLGDPIPLPPKIIGSAREYQENNEPFQHVFHVISFRGPSRFDCKA
jgi:hypothetical protein